MKSLINSKSGNKLIASGALIALAGYILSGPVGTVAVQLLKPQPAWQSAKVFADNYHFIQDVPFYFGFLLLGGMLVLAVGHYINARENEKRSTLLSLAFTVSFVTLIFFNYICQTTYVRQLAIHYSPQNDEAISQFSMANPQSLCWAIEMWGYAILGAATWLWAGYYKENKTIRALLIANGIISIAGALLTVANASWVLTNAGLIAYLVWNILMIAMMIFIYRNAKAGNYTPLKVIST